MVKVHVLFFAKSRELAKTSRTIFTVEPAVIVASQLLKELSERYNLTTVRENLILAHNENYIENLDEEITLQEGDEIAVIPPISGG